ncbi:MAG: alkyl hydroperoxide reductase subunit F [Candidatus Paceibacteria bacterium]|jgi:alkyl hydroperoxide reductase subunit F
MYDLAIIGGGPAGVSAGVYASRKQLKTVLITKNFDGQSIVSDGIENWIGTISITGADLSKSLENHLMAYAEGIVDVKKGQLGEKVEKDGDIFKITTDKGEVYEAKSVLIATGSSRTKLPAKNADIFEHKGITYCASCDGPVFSGKDVVVIGGGNAGFESAAQLLAYTKSVTMLHRNPEFLKADKVTVDAVTRNPKFKAIMNADTTEVIGDKFVTGLKYKDLLTEEEVEIKTDGIFVEIGNQPTTGMVEGLVPLDNFKRIEVDPWNQRTSVDGVWAAGDCTNGKYHQNNIAAGDAVKALEDIYLWVKGK